jgi:hypothetical protein
MTGSIGEKRMAFPAALFWGALWGLAEATAGHLLHLVGVPGLAGFIMFPFGLLLMSRAFRQSGTAGTIFLTAAVAAGMKLFDLFLPGTDPTAAFRPALAILCEGLTVTALYAFARTVLVTRKPSGPEGWALPFRSRD